MADAVRLSSGDSNGGNKAVDARYVCCIIIEPLEDGWPSFTRTLDSMIMKLDDLYSELTLNTGAKLVLLVLDGLGDIATNEQGSCTPLEAAFTPSLDR